MQEGKPYQEGKQYRGLIVDFGGVLTTNLFGALMVFCQQRGLAPDTFVRMVAETGERGRELWHAVERGDVDQRTFEIQLAEVLQQPEDGLLRALLAGINPDEEMLALVRRARAAGVRTAVLSNSWGDDPYDPYKPWRLDTLVDHVVISHRVRLRKPDPAIYRLAVDGVGLDPAACVFVDDMAVNLPPAEQLGMAAVHHVDTSTTVPRVEHLLGLPAPGPDRNARA